jgi:hypothetical protein
MADSEDVPTEVIWPIRIEDVAPLEHLLEAIRSLAPLASRGNDLIALGEVCGAIENILESKIVDVNVGLTVGFRHGDTEFMEGIFTCIRVNANEIVLDELHTTYSSDVGSDHFTRFYTSLEPGGGFDEAEIGDWISKLEELCAWEEAGLSVERNG